MYIDAIDTPSIKPSKPPEASKSILSQKNAKRRQDLYRIRRTVPSSKVCAAFVGKGAVHHPDDSGVTIRTVSVALKKQLQAFVAKQSGSTTFFVRSVSHISQGCRDVWVTAQPVVSSGALVVFAGAENEGEPLPSSSGNQFVPSLELARFLTQNRSSPTADKEEGSDNAMAVVLNCRSEITEVVDRLFSSLASALSDSGGISFDLFDEHGRLAPPIAKALGVRLGIAYYAEAEFAKRIGNELKIAVSRGYLARGERYSLAADDRGNAKLHFELQALPDSVLARGLRPLAEKGRVVRPKSLRA